MSASIRPEIMATFIPATMKQYPQWLLWRYEIVDGRLSKIPYIAGTKRKASSTNPGSWCSFDKAMAELDLDSDQYYSGLGFALSKDNHLSGIDIDHCIFNGQIEPWAQEIVDRFKSYSEISPSGTGIRIFYLGTLPGTGKKAKVAGTDGGAVEIYDASRYLTVTSNILLCSHDDVVRADDAFAWLYKKYFISKNQGGTASGVAGTSKLSDDTVIKNALSAANGNKIKKLMEGDMTAYNDDHSSADFALCSLLSFYCGNDIEQIDRIFRSSSLYRDKWERRDYRERTIIKSLSETVDIRQQDPIEDIFSKPLNYKPRFHFMSAKEICANPIPLQWLIKGVLDKDSLALTFGETGSFKSFLAIDQGLCIAAKIKWQGHETRNHGPVFYICGEGFRGVSKRIKAWCLHNNISPDNLPFFVSTVSASLLSQGGKEEISGAIDCLIEEHGEPVLIIIDTLNRNFGPGDENSTEDMTVYIDASDYIRHRYKCCVSSIHHTGLSAKDRARGAGALKAAMDWEYCMEIEEGGILKFSCGKGKDFEKAQPVYMRREIIPIGWFDEDGEELTSCVLVPVDEGEIKPKIEKNKLTGTQSLALKTLKAIGKPAHIEEWRTALYKAGLSAGNTQDAKRKAFKRAVSDLIKLNLIEAPEEDVWMIKKENPFDFNN